METPRDDTVNTEELEIQQQEELLTRYPSIKKDTRERVRIAQIDQSLLPFVTKTGVVEEDGDC